METIFNFFKDINQSGVYVPFLFGFFCICLTALIVVFIDLLYFVIKNITKRNKTFF